MTTRLRQFGDGSFGEGTFGGDWTIGTSAVASSQNPSGRQRPWRFVVAKRGPREARGIDRETR